MRENRMPPPRRREKKKDSKCRHGIKIWRMRKVSCLVNINLRDMPNTKVWFFLPLTWWKKEKRDRNLITGFSRISATKPQHKISSAPFNWGDDWNEDTTELGQHMSENSKTKREAEVKNLGKNFNSLWVPTLTKRSKDWIIVILSASSTRQIKLRWPVSLHRRSSADPPYGAAGQSYFQSLHQTKRRWQ